MTTEKNAIVYSTDHGRMCPECREPQSKCVCQAHVATPPPGDGFVRIGLETKKRNGKSVTTIRGVPLPLLELEALSKELKRLCGSGGTVKDFIIEIQGDHRQNIRSELATRGFRIKG